MAGRHADARRSMGLSGIQQQVYRKVTKKGYDFTLMVAGETSLGKSTMVRTLFMQPNNESDTDCLSASERIKQTVHIEERNKTITDGGLNLRLTIIDTPGFADAVDNSDCWQPLVNHIDDAFDLYLSEENKLDRSTITDRRVHVLLYFLDPSCRGLKPVDIEAMKALCNKVNIIPVIGKADTLTKDELADVKAQIKDDLEKNMITTFVPAVDEDDAESRSVSQHIQKAMPFALIGSDSVIEVGGQAVRGRKYPWGFVEVDNPAHCDFDLLRNTLVKTHLEDLKEATHELYENYRKDKLRTGDTSMFPGANASVLDEDTLRKMEEAERQQQELARQQEELAEQRRKFEEERRQFEEWQRQNKKKPSRDISRASLAREETV
eukprot:TRINITY_DN8078_c0_g1_i2.p1 TRINITY_DN8078_c0_g1~~TRINITY_DN8078_c0_g1_i2.p1  ORF type:complete len:379 (+),score=97.87 TRINITY_DN8078_c0_g1_i2:91-1227(+)